MTASEDGALRTLIVDDEPLAIERMQVLCAELEQLAGGRHRQRRRGGAAAGRQAQARPAAARHDHARAWTAWRSRAQLGRARQPAGGDLRHRARGFRGRGVRSRRGRLCAQAGRRRTARARDRPRASRAARARAAREGGEWLSEFWVPHRSELLRIEAAQVERIDAERDYVRLHVGERRQGAATCCCRPSPGSKGGSTRRTSSASTARPSCAATASAACATKGWACGRSNSTTAKRCGSAAPTCARSRRWPER